MEVFETENEFGRGVVKSWASILDDNTREQAERISRVPVVEGHLALMPDAHFGYGPPVGSALKTRNAVMPYAVGVDIGCGMIAVQTALHRSELEGREGHVLQSIRELIPSGVGKGREEEAAAWYSFVNEHGYPPGVDNKFIVEAARQRHHETDGQVRDDLMKRARLQFATLGAGNHFVEVCYELGTFEVWLVLHSGSRGIGNALATAHHKLSQESCQRARVALESPEFSYFAKGSPSFDDYIADMLWCQNYAFAQREEMMNRLRFSVSLGVRHEVHEVQRINCHHNYAEELEPGLWLTRKGAINAEVGRMGIIPGSMGALTYIVVGRGEPESYQTSPHGAGRMMSRGAARKTLDLGDFKAQMQDKTWLDRDAEKLLDEAPAAYKPIDTVIADSRELVTPTAKLTQIINYKGL